MLRAILRRSIVWFAVLVVLGVWSTQTASAAESPAGILEGARIGEMSVGVDHACAIRTTGELVCWGDNSQQEGTPPSGLFVQVSAGTDFTCAIRDDGTLACWGLNDQGQTDVPPGLYREVSAGADHACAIRDDGVALCWGNATGTVPEALFVRLAAGDGFTCGLVDGYTLSCWGANDDGQTSAPSGHYTQLSAGFDHACAIRDDGLPQCWGNNANGKATPAAGVFVQLSAGVDRTCGVREDGVAVCWGVASSPPSALLVSLDVNDGACGLQGDGTLTCWDRANLQAPPSGTFTRRTLDMEYIGMGCVIKEQGALECWQDYTWFTPVGQESVIYSNNQGQGNGCVLTLDRTPTCWYGTQSITTTTTHFRTINTIRYPEQLLCATSIANELICDHAGSVNIPFPSKRFIDIVNHTYFMCGLRSDGGVECKKWGLPGYGYPAPSVPADRRYLQIVDYINGICGLKADGTIECWGTLPEYSLPSGRYIQLAISKYSSRGCGLRGDRMINCLGYEATPSQRYTSVSTVGVHCGIRVDTLIDCWDADYSIGYYLGIQPPLYMSFPIGYPVQTYGFGIVHPLRNSYNNNFHYPIKAKIIQGNLPEGVLLAESGMVTGTATVTSVPSIFTVTAQLTNRLNFVDTKPFTVMVAHLPIADAGPDRFVQPAGSTVQLDSSNSYDPDNLGYALGYRWKQIGGPTVTLNNSSTATPTFTAPALGSVLTFELIVYRYGIGSLPDTVVITVGNPPLSNLHAGVRLPSVTSESTPFTATVQGTNVSYSWSFGDGGTATGASPTYTYTTPGTYTAIVTATNGVSTLSRSLSVPVRSRPVADAGIDIQTTVGMTITLDGSASTDPANEPLSYRWHQTSGPSATLLNPTGSHPQFKAPTTPATLDFSLVVTSTNGVADSSPDSVRVTVSDTPLSSLGAVRTAPVIAGETVVMTASVQGSNPVYIWAFGDGTTATGRVVTHTYASHGSYTATVTATNGTGILATGLGVPVLARPTAHAGTDHDVTVGATITLNGTASTDPDNQPLQYYWRQISGPSVMLSDSFSSQPSFVAPSQPASLAFTLVVTNTSGLGDQSPDAVQVMIRDVAVSELAFSAPAPQPLGTTMHLTATVAAGSNVSYAWDFGDGTMGSGRTTSHTYATPGTYSVTLTATNSRGSQSVTHPVTIVQTTWQIYTPYLTKSASCPPVCGLQQALGRAFGR